MGFKNFSVQLSVRVLLLMLVLSALVYLLLVPGYPTLGLLLAGAVILLLIETIRFIHRTNRELTRFLDAIRYADFGQRFHMQQVGAGFEELGGVFTSIIQRFQDLRNQQEETLRHLRALMEHVPAPLLSLHQDDKLELHNNAARRLFGSTRVETLEDLLAFGEDFHRHIRAVAPGERRLAVFQHAGVEQRFTISATEIAIAGKVERLVSLQNNGAVGRLQLAGSDAQVEQAVARIDATLRGIEGRPHPGGE